MVKQSASMTKVNPPTSSKGRGTEIGQRPVCAEVGLSCLYFANKFRLYVFRTFINCTRLLHASKHTDIS